MMLAVQPTLISLSRLALKPYPAHLRDHHHALSMAR